MLRFAEKKKIFDTLFEIQVSSDLFVEQGKSTFINHA